MLNHAQQQAVRVVGHALITACPGSGKTTVLKHRAKFLLQLDPDCILCGVTFTSESAAELDSRIRAEVPNVGDRVICGTFHSLCKRQLTRAGRKFVLITDVQQSELMRRAHFETAEDTGCTLEAAVMYIEHVKCQVDPILPSPHVEPRVAVYERYQELLRQMGAMDFSDLLVECVRGMKTGEVAPVSNSEGRPITTMLVDEFQDTDEVQLAWVKEHIRHGATVTVVGDDDQSIYGWRNALGYQGMERFRKDTNATHIALNLTYRCSREIIAPAARLITHNTERVEKVLDTANKDRGDVKLMRFNSEQEEVDGILRAIAQSGKWGDWGVLARTNAQLDSLERALLSEKIDYVRSGGTSFWELRGPALFLGVCQSMATGDMIGVDELMRKIGVGESQIASLHKACNSRIPGALDRFLQGAAAIEPKKDDKLGTLRKRLAEWRAMIAKREEVLALDGLARYIRSNAKLYDKVPDAKSMERDGQMLRQCAETLSRLSGNLGARLITLRNSDRKKSDSKEEAVRLLTLHSSKGLEFERVWMVGCEQGVLPSRQSPIPEERRLFFVGMTRAKRHLFMSYVRSQRTPPSMFLQEAGIN